MPKKTQTQRYMRAEDFFKSPRKTTIAADVRKQMAQEREKTILDMTLLRQQEDWSFLANKVVGAEGT